MFHGKVTCTGSYLPKRSVSNDELSQYVDTSDEWIFSRTGIKERRIATEESVSEMATAAALRALEKGKIDPAEIDMIVTATVSSDYAMPSIACIVQGNIEAVNAFGFDLQAACSGFIYGLEVIEQYIQSGRVKKALLIGVEKLSQLLDWKDRGTCVLFGDGAGAVIIEATEDKIGVVDTCAKSIGSDYGALVSPIRHNDTPFYQQAKVPFLTMDGRAVFQFAITKVPALLKEVMEKNQMTAEDIDCYVLHQANSRIIESIAKKLKQPIEKFYMNMDRFGNTSAATIPIALDELAQKGELANKTIAISGFGAGLTYGVGIIRF